MVVIKKKEIIIPKDKAVFWLNARGQWCNNHGPFQHKKIIDYFHTSIRRDKDDYYVSQEREGLIEKVYFNYEDTALFVFKVIIKGDDTRLKLNTGKTIRLMPRKLIIKNDCLYMQKGGELIKFTERSMMQTSNLFEEDNKGLYFVIVKGRRYQIKEI